MSLGGSSAGSPSSSAPPTPAPSTSTSAKRIGSKANVSSACGPCKRAHLACDVARPCKRCVNIGKADLCEDVPHKKRGRPKSNKSPLAEPYPRSRLGDDAGPSGLGKWRGPSSYDTPYLTSTASPPPYLSRPPSPRSSFSDSSLGGGPYASASASTMPPGPDLFSLFCTTDLKILRASPASQALTGYHPHEFVNLSLNDWLHPSDRHLIASEHQRLIAVPYLSATLQSNRETHAAIMQCTERELLSPATGMREPYPNQNVRFLRADNTFALFNLRLHLGGGLGGSLWQPETLGQIYLVVSCLLVSDRESPSDNAARRPSQATLPPTPVTPLHPTSSQSLPSFSSIAAAADATQGSSSRYDHNQQQPPPQGSYYSAAASNRSTPGASVGHSHVSSQQAHTFPYARSDTVPSTNGTNSPAYPLHHRSPSPPPASYRNSPAHGPPPLQQYPPPFVQSGSGHYPPAPPHLHPQPQHQHHHQPSHQHQLPHLPDPRASLHQLAPLPSMANPTSAPAPASGPVPVPVVRRSDDNAYDRVRQRQQSGSGSVESSSGSSLAYGSGPHPLYRPPPAHDGSRRTWEL